MERTIENGVTILSAHKFFATENKHGATGIVSRGEKFEAIIHIKRKKYSMGFFDTLEKAKKARVIAEQKKKDGSFLAWFDTLPHGNSKRFEPFWDAEFARISNLRY